MLRMKGTNPSKNYNIIIVLKSASVYRIPTISCVLYVKILAMLKFFQFMMSFVSLSGWEQNRDANSFIHFIICFIIPYYIQCTPST